MEATPATPEESAEDEPDYENMSDDEVENEIAKLLAQRQAEDKAKREAKIAAGETVPTPPPAPDEEPKKEEPKKPTPAPTKPAPTPKRETPSKTSGDVKAAAPAKKQVAPEQTIRVDVKRLDHLMNLIGELVLAKNRLIKINDDMEDRYEGEEFLEELNQVVSIVSLVTTDLQIAVMKTRMLPVGKVFNKFPRMIRDLSRELNKKIDLLSEKINKLDADPEESRDF